MYAHVNPGPWGKTTVTLSDFPDAEEAKRLLGLVSVGDELVVTAIEFHDGEQPRLEFVLKSRAQDNRLGIG